jgi:hypothetical protein
MKRICHLDASSGNERRCSEVCAFWEPGGAVVEGRCAFEQLDFAGRPGLVAEMIHLRDLLDAAAPAVRDSDAWREYRRVLNESGEE